MYADDVAVLFDSLEQLEGLTLALESHSHRNNYRFNTRKCELMGTREEMTIYGQNVTHCHIFKYLGCMMDCDGICWSQHITRLAEKTRNMLNFMKSIGYSSGGFREKARYRFSKPF